MTDIILKEAMNTQL